MQIITSCDKPHSCVNVKGNHLRVESYDAHWITFFLLSLSGSLHDFQGFWLVIISVLFPNFCIKLALELIKFFGRHCSELMSRWREEHCELKFIHLLFCRTGGIFLYCNRLQLFDIFVRNYMKSWKYLLLRLRTLGCCCFNFGSGGLKTVWNCSNIWRKLGDYLLKTDIISWKIICQLYFSRKEIIVVV